MNEANAKWDWTLVQKNISPTTTTQFTLPSDCNEVLVGVTFSENRIFVISKTFYRGYDFTDSDYTLHMLGGYQLASSFAGCYIGVKTGNVYVDSVWYNGKDIKNNTKYFVAYR